MDDHKIEKRKRILEAGTELKKALEAWESMAKHSQTSLSPDDQALEDVQTLLRQLKRQIEELS